MKLVNIQQGTQEWSRWRATGLGGSDAPVVMRNSPHKGPRTLWEIMTQQREPEPSTYAMRRGQWLEPVCRRLYIQQTGRIVIPACAVHDEYEWMRASLDGITIDLNHLAECKAIKFEYHQMVMAGKVPDLYWPQVQHQLAVSGAYTCDFVSYSEKKGLAKKDQLAIVTVRPDHRYIERLIKAEEEFMGWVRARSWPANQPG